MRITTLLAGAPVAFLTIANLALAIEVDLTSFSSVQSAASSIAFDMMSFYNGNTSGNIPGLLPEPPSGYYWWEAGAMWGTMIDYWFVTGDTTYNDVVEDAMLFQVGPNQDYMPPNQSKSLGNDDQGFWGMAAMTAAETNFQNPPSNQPQWLALAQAVFNTQASRWDNTSCGGGLRWQIFTFNNGYNYKNSISNGCFFNLGARLARYTNNETYADWAEKTWNWVEEIGLIDGKYYIYDGTDDGAEDGTGDGASSGGNCSVINHVQFSYQAGVYLLGAANMYNYTNGSDIWKTRTQGILDAALTVFTDKSTGIMVEEACELQNPPTCDTDMLSFKAYLSRWMAAATKRAPFIYDQVHTALVTSATAAAQQCSGGANGRMCGLKWTDGPKWDGSSGVGQQMAALEVIISTQIAKTQVPFTNTTGGTSEGNPNAGAGSVDTASGLNNQPVTTGDRAGAGILTAVICIALMGGVAWMMIGE